MGPLACFLRLFGESSRSKIRDFPRTRFVSGMGGLPNWPAYDAARRAVMFFDNPCHIKSNPEGEGLRLIREAVS